MVLLVIRRLDPVSVKLDGEADCVEKVGYRERIGSICSVLEKILPLNSNNKFRNGILQKKSYFCTAIDNLFYKLCYRNKFVNLEIKAIFLNS